MVINQRIIVVMPAFKAAKTVEQTWRDLPHDIVDSVLLVDDASPDNTSAIAKQLGIKVIVHEKNLGYGGNQKTCYREALADGADIIVMVHPDYQYEPKLVTAMAAMVQSGVYDVVLGSRIIGGGALRGGMPAWKYIANRILTFLENILLGAKLSEYHTGYRAYSRKALQSVDFECCSDDFIFDNEILCQFILGGVSIGEISCPTKYFEDASSINFSRSVKYGFGVLRVSICGLLRRAGLKVDPTLG